jgi:hypothetical protein
MNSERKYPEISSKFLYGVYFPDPSSRTVPAMGEKWTSCMCQRYCLTAIAYPPPLQTALTSETKSMRLLSGKSAAK